MFSHCYPTNTGLIIDRVMFTLQHLQEPFYSDSSGDRRFKSQLQDLHMDEKWFFVTKEKQAKESCSLKMAYEKRLALLAAKVAVVKVGANSEIEL